MAFDWDKWNKSLWMNMPKNRMWGKIRNGTVDGNGVPVKRYADATAANNDTVSTDKQDTINEHWYKGQVSGQEQDLAGDVPANTNWADHVEGQL